MRVGHRQRGADPARAAEVTTLGFEFDREATPLASFARRCANAISNSSGVLASADFDRPAPVALGGAAFGFKDRPIAVQLEHATLS